MFAGLIFVGCTSVLLLISSVALINTPEAPFRWFGTIVSFASSMALMTAGAGSIYQTIFLSRDLDIYCQGGFPNMANMALTYLDEIHKIEHYYVRENMCVKNRCPCSTKIDRNAFGVRSSELDSLEIFEG
jgi:hypothetical protein